MSTGENINANKATLSQGMIHAGLKKFPQTITAQVSVTAWPAIKDIQFSLNPYHAGINPAVPPTEVWFVGTGGVLLGRIVNLAHPPGGGPLITQDDSLDFVDDEADQPKVFRQRDRRVKDALL